MCSQLKTLQVTLAAAPMAMMPHEAPANLPRRASDPVRRNSYWPTLLAEGSAIQQHQQHDHVTSARNRSTYFQLAEQHLVWWQLASSSFSQRPPSISENVFNGGIWPLMEVISMKMIWCYQMTWYRYLNSQNGSSNQDPGISVNGGHALDFHGNMISQQQFYGQRRMGITSNNGSQVEPVCLGPEQMADPQGMNKNNMPVQWNEVSSGSVDTTARLPKQQQLRGNLTVVQQKQNFGSYQGFGTNQQIVPMSQNLASLQQGYLQRATQRMNSVQQYRQSVTNPCQNLSEQVNPQPG